MTLSSLSLSPAEVGMRRRNVRRCGQGRLGQAACREMLARGDQVMASSGEHIKALVRSHASGDEDSFYAVAMQVAARAARQGHNRLAQDLKQTIDASRRQPVVKNVTPIAQPRGDLADLVTASFPRVGLRDLVAPDQLLGQVRQVLAEQRQRQVLLERGFSPAHRLLLEGPPGRARR